MIVIKRDGTKEEFSIEKVISAVNKSAMFLENRRCPLVFLMGELE